MGDTIFETSFISIELKLFLTSDNELLTSLTLCICISRFDDTSLRFDVEDCASIILDINEVVRLL